MKQIFKRITKGFLALLVLCGIMSSNNQTNMYALAASGSKRNKRTSKVAKKKHPKRKPRNNNYSKQWQKRELAAKKWIIKTESGGRWNVRSYGSNCVGRYQLRPSYLGYKNGHINLNHKHQDQVAEKYVHNRYGSWQKAKAFHLVHGWY